MLHSSGKSSSGLVCCISLSYSHPSMRHEAGWCVDFIEQVHQSKALKIALLLPQLHAQLCVGILVYFMPAAQQQQL